MMVWEINYQPDYKVVVIKTKGNLPYEELPKQFQIALDLARQKGVESFLFDDTELNIHVSTVDIYEIPKFLLSLGVSWSSRFAIVISPDENRVEDYQFLETVGRNLGYNVRLFFSLQSGYDWLSE